MPKVKTPSVAPATTIVRGTIVTMNAARDVISDGAVVVAGGVITAVGAYADVAPTGPATTIVGRADSLVTPGYVNAHQHVTGDRLVHSCIPDAIDSQDAIYGWAVPVHSAHTGDDDELSASLAAAEALSNGVTCTVEAGTVGHPDRVATALRRAGMRAMLGQWGWDIDDAPFAAPADEVLARQTAMLDVLPAGGLVEAWVTLVGHDLMSDDLVTRASALARDRGVGITFHMSPHAGDAVSSLNRTGRRPFVHLDDLGVLGRHVLVAHGVHLDNAEVDIVLRTETAIAACPWAYLRLAQGVTVAGRHGDLFRRGGRLALGCDAENAGDAVDILRAAALFVGLERDRAMDAFSITAHHGLELATVRGAEATGKDAAIGSLEVGKQADIVVHDTSGPQWVPMSSDPVLQLIWASDGRSVSDVLVAGRHVVSDGRCTSVDVDGLRAEATARRDFFLAQRG
ncbi:MAG: putative hydrolase [Ilumatobacteraceae bacterium]|nr:putative hydrolase [Ilumatobacteraceae bacterium]